MEGAERKLRSRLTDSLGSENADMISDWIESTVFACPEAHLASTVLRAAIQRAANFDRLVLNRDFADTRGREQGSSKRPVRHDAINYIFAVYGELNALIGSAILFTNNVIDICVYKELGQVAGVRRRQAFIHQAAATARKR